MVPLPAVPPSDLTIAARNDAVALSYQGRLEEAVDIYRGTVESDGFMAGILSTMADGILALAPEFTGSPEMVSALLDVDGTPGDFAAMHPRQECSKILKDGIGLGFGLGQYVRLCWNCGSIDVDPVTSDGVTKDVCHRCMVDVSARPAGMRTLYQLRWRDARWLFRNPITLRWYYTGRNGMIEIVPGDGEWFLFFTVPDQDCWRHGPWVSASVAAIFARDATYDRQNTSAVCAPARVFEAQSATAYDTRLDVEQKASEMKFGNSLVLPGEWKYRIESASGDYVAVCKEIVEWGRGSFEVQINGHMQGLVSGTGFANIGEFSSTTRARRTYYAGQWIEQICSQGLTWWGRDNFGTSIVPVGRYDVRSPEEKLADSKALDAEGAALKSYSAGLDAVGFEIDPAWLQEREQKEGRRVRPKDVPVQVSKLDLGVDATMALVSGAEGKISLGLKPFGDARDYMTISQLALLPPGPVPGIAPALTSTSAGAAAPDGADATQDAQPDHAARLAEEMTAHGVTSCEHGSLNRCRLCGVERVRGVIPGKKPGEHTWAMAWRPIAAPAPPAAPVVQEMVSP